MEIKELNKDKIKIIWIDEWNSFPTSGLLKYEDKDYYYESVNHTRFVDSLNYVVYNPETDDLEDLEIEDLIVWYYVFLLEKEDLDRLYKRRAYFELSKSNINSLDDYYSKNTTRLNLKSNNILGFFRLSSSDLEELKNGYR